MFEELKDFVVVIHSTEMPVGEIVKRLMEKNAEALEIIASHEWLERIPHPNYSWLYLTEKGEAIYASNMEDKDEIIERIQSLAWQACNAPG